MATHAISLQLLSSQVHDTARVFQAQLLPNRSTQVLFAADWLTLRIAHAVLCCGVRMHVLAQLHTQTTYTWVHQRAHTDAMLSTVSK
jgi:hypothetical protein